MLDALDSAGVRAALTGGWGIDALLRRETREHAAVDLGVPSDAETRPLSPRRSG